jgi:hypothetical protein
MALQAFNRLVGRGQAYSETLSVLSAMLESGMDLRAALDWVIAEADRNVENLRAAGDEWAEVVRQETDASASG